MKHFGFVDKNGAFQISDIISFNLNDGEAVEALAVKQEDDGMIFCTVDCLKEERPMIRSGNKAKDYDGSDLRKEMNNKIIERFPADIRERMVPFSNGDLLRLPTEKEIFGENIYGDEEPESVKQWEPMKLRRNRIAFQGSNGPWEWYWLQNRVRDVASATYFAIVHGTGSCGYGNASYSDGVRPAFKIKNP